MVSDTGNYYANADYFYLFNQSQNTLTVMYYRGATLSIKHKILVNQEVVPEGPTPTYMVCVTNGNESLFVQLSVWVLNDKSVQIDYESLHEVFQQQVISINLRRHVKGPLVQFYAADESLAEGTYFTGLTLVDLRDPVFNQNILENMLGIRFSEDVTGTSMHVIFRSIQSLFVLGCDLGYD